MSDTKTAEALWNRAHEHVKRGDFANAVRDLAACYQILHALNDPRVYEVHKRWTDVHRMYMEDGQKKPEPVQNKAPTLEAEAESAANAGDLDKALELYRRAQQQNPGNELITERIVELTKAKARAHDLVNGTAPPVASTTTPTTPATTPAATTQGVGAVQAGAKAEDDWSDVNVDEPAAAAAASVQVVAHAETRTNVAPTMAVEDAPVGMQSLDVPFSVGEPIDEVAADELPVAGGSSRPPASAGDDVAFLEELLSRVQANRAELRAARS